MADLAARPCAPPMRLLAAILCLPPALPAARHAASHVAECTTLTRAWAEGGAGSSVSAARYAASAGSISTCATPRLM